MPLSIPGLLHDGVLVLTQNAGAALTVIAGLMWGSIVVALLLFKFSQGALEASEYLSLALGGSLVVILITATLIFFAGAVLGARPGLEATVLILGAVIAGTAVVTRAWRAHLSARGLLGLLPYLGLLLLAVLVRLAFAAHTPLPLYFDSAEHYRIARLLSQEYLQGSFGSGLTWPTPSYYHFGFHILMALMTVIPRQDLGTMMLVSGQLILASIPLCLLFLVERETSSFGAGFMAVVLAWVGWNMPSFAVNWGKYPAVFSLPAVFFCLDVAYLAGKREGHQRAILLIVALIAALSAFVLQTRALILIVIGLSAWWSASRWAAATAGIRAMILSLALMMVAILIGAVALTPTLALVFDPYVGSGLTITVFAGLLGALGIGKYPRLVFASLLGAGLLLLALFVPVPGFNLSPLLDRPLVEMVLFAPLALLAGSGIASVGAHFSPVAMPIRAAGIVVLSLAVAAHAAINYSWYPSDCCQLVHGDDLVALDWIEQNLPESSVVAISQDELQDAPAPYPSLLAATDGGAWVTALTGRRTAGIPRTSDFGAQAVLKELCGAGIEAVYAGSAGFDAAGLARQPNWYQLELYLPGAQVYRVTGCATGRAAGPPTAVKTP